MILIKITNTHLNIMLNSLSASSVTPVVFLKDMEDPGEHGAP